MSPETEWDAIVIGSGISGGGMIGNVVTAELKQWSSDALNNVSVAVGIWRLGPDDDPNLVDPNDPNMKNYFVNALLGKVYNQERPQAG